MISTEAIFATLMPTLNIFLFVAITLGTAIQNNSPRSRRFSREISVVEFLYSGAIVFDIHSNFTYISETSDIVKLYLSLDSSFVSI